MELTISLNEFLAGGYFPPYQAVSYEDGKYIKVEDKDFLRALFDISEEVYIRFSWNSKFFKHRLCPRVISYNKDGSPTKSREGGMFEQSLESYKDYQLFIYNRFMEGRVYIKKD